MALQGADGKSGHDDGLGQSGRWSDSHAVESFAVLIQRVVGKAAEDGKTAYVFF